MERLLIFGILSLPLILISWRTLFLVKSHGFYRFLSWECIIWLVVTNYPFWFNNPLSIPQLFSWVFLFGSVYLVTAGTILLKKKGKPLKDREDQTLYQFEKTTELIDQGIFKYIRHPLYSSLLFLSWGIFLKNTADLSSWIATILSTLFLYLAAIMEEKECIRFFGDRYSEYMKRSKRFIPFIL